MVVWNPDFHSRKNLKAADAFFERLPNLANGFISSLASNNVMEGKVRVAMIAKYQASSVEGLKDRSAAFAAECLT